MFHCFFVLFFLVLGNLTQVLINAREALSHCAFLKNRLQWHDFIQTIKKILSFFFLHVQCLLVGSTVLTLKNRNKKCDQPSYFYSSACVLVAVLVRNHGIKSEVSLRPKERG